MKHSIRRYAGTFAALLAVMAGPALSGCGIVGSAGSAPGTRVPAGTPTPQPAAEFQGRAPGVAEAPALPGQTPPPAVDTPTPVPTDTTEPPPAPATATSSATPSATAALTRTPTPTATATGSVIPRRTATPKPAARQSPTPATSAPAPEATGESMPTAAPGTVAPTVAANVPAKGGIKAPTGKYTVYIPAATKKNQEYHYSCEFDAAWVVLKTFGYSASVAEQVAIVGQDTGIEPYYVENKDGIFIYGGDITRYYSGDYKENFLARSSGEAMRKVFEHFGLAVNPVHTRQAVQEALSGGRLVWVKIPVDFKGWRAATWVMPDGRTYKTVLGNDHAVTVIGYNNDVVVIRDVLGPTSTNRKRPYEYEVSWDRFMAAWGAQSFDGLAVGKP